MAFSGAYSISWQYEKLLKELIDALNERRVTTGEDSFPALVTNPPASRTNIQAGFWQALQGAVSTLAVAGWAQVHEAGVLQSVDWVIGKAAMPVYTTVSEIFEAMGCTSEHYQDGSGGYNFRRLTWTASGGYVWQPAGAVQDYDVINNHLIEDMQIVLKALRVRAHGYPNYSWKIAGTLGTDYDYGLGEGIDAAAAIADYAYQDGSVNGFPLARVGTGPLQYEARRSASRPQIGTTYPIEETYEKNVHFFTIPLVPYDGTWSDQGDGWDMEAVNLLSSLIGVTIGNAGTGIFEGDLIGADNIATAPPDAPVSPKTARGWEMSGDTWGLVDYGAVFQYL